MKGLWKLTFIEMKLFMREPAAAFFTLVFPLMVLLIFGTIYGNEPTPFFGDYGTVDVSVPAYAGMIIGSSGLIGITIVMSTYRERGILRRLNATPVRPQIVLGANVIGMMLFYPMLFLCGAAVPLEVLPEKVRRYTSLLPLTQVVKLLRGLWIGESWSQHWTEAGMLAAMLLIGVAVSAKTFRWE